MFWPADRPFVDRPARDHDGAARALDAALARWDVVGTPRLLRHGMNSLYTVGDIVFRVGSATASAVSSHRLVNTMLSRGIATVEPVDGLAADVDEFAVTGWRYHHEIDGTPDWESIGGAVRLVHGTAPDRLPSTYPVPRPTRFPWWDFDAVLSRVASHLDRPARRGIEAAIDAHRWALEQLDQGAVVCHGDVHPGNVLVAEPGSLLIDWDLVCWSNPAWDHAPLVSVSGRWGGDPDWYGAFASGYGANMAQDEITLSLAELRDVAATLLKVEAGTRVRSARTEAERRLESWRGSANPPVWQAQ